MVEPRKYAMTKAGPGDWLCPNNEGTLLWRFTRYYEDGTAISGSWPDERPIFGWFWMASFIPMRDEWTGFRLNDEEWTEWAIMLPTRDTAIAEMLEHSASVIASHS